MVSDIREEIILSTFDTELGCSVGTKLLTYPDGTMDLLRELGGEFNTHIGTAKATLKMRGLVASDAFVRRHGRAYAPVRKALERHFAEMPLMVRKSSISAAPDFLPERIIGAEEL